MEKTKSAVATTTSTTDDTVTKMATQLNASKLIIVTGFGPFVGHENVNASWEAVTLLPNELTFKGNTYKLEKQMISVEYAAVDKAVPAIWARKPELVIHCGVHGFANCVRVEKLAYNHKFNRPDYAGKRLRKASARLVNCGEGIRNDVIRCRLNVDKIVENVGELHCECLANNEKINDISINKEQENEEEEQEEDEKSSVATAAKASNDVGNYLCGYIYLKSLDMNDARTLFVHVPPIDKPFSSAQTADIILNVIEECVRQVEEDIKDIC